MRTIAAVVGGRVLLEVVLQGFQGVELDREAGGRRSGRAATLAGSRDAHHAELEPEEVFDAGEQPAVLLHRHFSHKPSVLQSKAVPLTRRLLRSCKQTCSCVKGLLNCHANLCK